MLNNFPSEIIVCIASNLSFHDRLELAKTCHKFNAIITQRCLYQELKLNAGLEKTRQIVRKFKSKQLNGNQVKHLEIVLSTLSNQLYRRLPVIFPNVTYISNIRGKEGLRDDYVIEPMKQWMNKLEEYDMTNGQLQLERLMLTNTFSRITSLIVSPDMDILGCLPNLPLLRRLVIFNFELDIDYLELLHSKCSKLVYFRLTGGMLRMVGDKTLPRLIEPLQNLSTFIITNDVAISDQKCLFLDYIVAKYTNLDHFNFLTNFRNALLSRHRSIRTQTGNISHSEFEATRTNYLKEGVSRFLTKLSSKIEKFSLEVSLFDNLYSGLTQSELNPRELQFYDCTESSQQKDEKLQLRYISTLSKLEKFTTTIDDAEDPFTRECRSVSLKTLVLTVRRRGNTTNNNNKHKELDFSRILFCFPSLNKFILDGNLIKLTTNDTFAARNAHFNLQHLQLKKCIMLPFLTTFLRHYAKRIDHLELPMTRLILTKGPNKGQSIKTYEINLPDHRLNTLKLTRLPTLRSNAGVNFSIYVEINAGYTMGKYTVETKYDDRITVVRDITNNTIDLTCDVIDLTDLPEENENLTKLIITLRDLKEFKLEGYTKDIPLHKIPPQPTIID